MEKVKKVFSYVLSTYPTWKRLESKRMKLLSALGLLFPAILVGVYYFMSTFFPKYLMFFFVALMPSCQSIDVAYSESMERTNHEIIKSHIEDNLDNPEIQRVEKEKGWVYLQKLLEDLAAPERVQLKLIYKFWKKLDEKVDKNADETVTKLVNEAYQKWRVKTNE